MKKLITTAEKLELVELGKNKNHRDAIVAFGADMYRKGMFTGAAALAVGLGIAAATSAIGYVIKERKKKHAKSETT